MTGVVRGRLLDPSAAPSAGERVVPLAHAGNLVVEQILSGHLDGPVDYLEHHDEWVVLLQGAAVLVVDGEQMQLGLGDWVLLPAGTAHRLVSTEPGTSWLAVHVVQS